jgi:hypothetical protein
MKKSNILLVTVLLVLQIGCTNMPTSGYDVTPKEELMAKPIDQIKSILAEEELLAEKSAIIDHSRLLQGIPVYSGDGKTGTARVWVPDDKGGSLTVYNGQVYDQFGLEQYSWASYRTDSKANILRDKNGRAIMDFEHAHAQSGLARLHEENFARMMGLAVQGSVPAAISVGAGGCRGNNCGPAPVIQDFNISAGAFSDAYARSNNSANSSVGVGSGIPSD